MISKLICYDFFSTLAINVMKLSVLSHLDDVFHLLHVLHVLQIYSIFSHPGWQDSTIFGALLQDNRHCRKYWPISGHTLPEAQGCSAQHIIPWKVGLHQFFPRILSTSPLQEDGFSFSLTSDILMAFTLGDNSQFYCSWQVFAYWLQKAPLLATQVRTPG